LSKSRNDQTYQRFIRVRLLSELLDDNSSITLSDVDTEWVEEEEKEEEDRPHKVKPGTDGLSGPDGSESQTLNTDDSDVTVDNTQAPPSTVSTTTERRRIVIHHKPRPPRTTTEKYFRPTLGGVAYESRDSDTAVSAAPSCGRSQNLVLIISVCVFVDLYRRVFFIH
jgi:hypothetical protein